jgi:hypothetical protein
LIRFREEALLIRGVLNPRRLTVAIHQEGSQCERAGIWRVESDRAARGNEPRLWRAR